MSISIDAAIKEGAAMQERRESEIFVKDGDTLVLNVDLGKSLLLTTRKGYKLYGVPCIEGDDVKHFYIFPPDAPAFFEVAKANGGKVVVTRESGKNTYS